MKLLNYQFKSKKDLEIFIEKNILNVGSILIQVFSGDLDVNNVQDIINLLKYKLLQANIIGASTAGEIINGVMRDNTIIISFSIFEKTKLRVSYYPKIDFKTGCDIANNFLASNTKSI